MEAIKRSIHGFIKYRYLISLRVKHEIKKKYKNSFLGILWSLLNPMLQMLVLTVIFSTIFKRSIENFALYMISGRLLYNYFSQATTGSLKSITGGSQLIQKIYFPKYILIVSRVMSDFIIMLISMIDLIIIMLVTGAEFTVYMWYAPIYLMLLSIFVLGCGLMLSTLNVFFRDMEHLYGVVTLVIMYCSAIFYPDTIIPEKFRPLLLFNPVFHYISGFRHAVYYATPIEMDNLLYCVGVAFGALLIGIWVFKRNQDKFILNI